MSRAVHQCACSAFFLSKEALDGHLEDIRKEESYHSARIEKCRTHSRVDDDDHPENPDNTPGDLAPQIKVCPFTDCVRTTPFATWQKLRRHFQQHVICHEVCVHCFRTFKAASEFIRHVEGNHKSETGRKATYMRATYEEIRRRVNSELTKAASLSASIESGRRKRACDVAGMELVMPGNKRIMDVDTLTNDTTRSLPSTQSATFPFPSGEAVEAATTMIHPDLAEQPGIGDSLDAPLLQMFSSVPYDENWGGIGINPNI